MNHRRPSGFSLLELLVVLGIISALLALTAPSFWSARQQSKRLMCQSNQRHIGVAIGAYAADHDSTFPMAQYFDARRGALVAWDTATPASHPGKVEPGLIVPYIGTHAVQQCPGFDGPSTTSGDEFTGYNYNTSYLGRGQGEGNFRNMDERPARQAQVRMPALTALVGDGGWLKGANKFMRSPEDSGVSRATVHAGGQAFRHHESTNVAFVDGHIESKSTPCRGTVSEPSVARLLDWPRNGFLSTEDGLYDLD